MASVPRIFYHAVSDGQATSWHRRHRPPMQKHQQWSQSYLSFEIVAFRSPILCSSLRFRFSFLLDLHLFAQVLPLNWAKND